MGVATLNRSDYKVADLSLAEFGRKEIAIAEHEMPGLMAILMAILTLIFLILSEALKNH